ncbi:hypothetical protein [uncultured Actinomyces sp.]|uniref:hypothetical protein n=1 Tax=uncultured Actinomyces sp. TaxID=249061 RepID=UPI0028EEB493|nr:hypothetical protein [uncultured Actinomyces sp.]
MNNNDYLAPFENILQSLKEMQETVQKEIEKDREANHKAEEQHAEAARRGELGEDWRKIQERIDNGNTTLSDIFSGEDSSEAAMTLRQTAQQNITRAMQQARQEAEENDEEDPFTVLQEKLSALSKATEERVRNLQGF